VPGSLVGVESRTRAVAGVALGLVTPTAGVELYGRPLQQPGTAKTGVLAASVVAAALGASLLIRACRSSDPPGRG
jgi:hypothetical protein